MSDKKSDKKDQDINAEDLLELDGFAEQIESLESQISQLQEQLESADSQKMRALADLENYRRRESEQKAQWSKIVVSDFLKKVIPSFLELSLGVEHSEDKAIKKVVEKFFSTLNKEGLSKIEPQSGEKIDPQFHEVLMAEEGDAGTVVKVLEPGWQYENIVILPAKISGAQH